MESQRIHSLDAMRAILMLLGVYFHLSLAYVTFGDGSEGWVKDPNSTSPFFDFIFAALHYFRMHGFFLIALARLQCILPLIIMKIWRDSQHFLKYWQSGRALQRGRISQSGQASRQR